MHLHINEDIEIFLRCVLYKIRNSYYVPACSTTARRRSGYAEMPQTRKIYFDAIYTVIELR